MIQCYTLYTVLDEGKLPFWSFPKSVYDSDAAS